MSNQLTHSGRGTANGQHAVMGYGGTGAFHHDSGLHDTSMRHMGTTRGMYNTDTHTGDLPPNSIHNPENAYYPGRHRHEFIHNPSGGGGGLEATGMYMQGNYYPGAVYPDDYLDQFSVPPGESLVPRDQYGVPLRWRGDQRQPMYYPGASQYYDSSSLYFTRPTVRYTPAYPAGTHPEDMHSEDMHLAAGTQSTRLAARTRTRENFSSEFFNDNDEAKHSKPLIPLRYIDSDFNYNDFPAYNPIATYNRGLAPMCDPHNVCQKFNDPERCDRCVLSRGGSLACTQYVCM